MISTYVNLDDYLTLCQRISLGRFGQLIEKAKVLASTSNKFPPELWKKQGGRINSDSSVSAWNLSIHPATKKGDVIIKAQKGVGKIIDGGLIQLIHNQSNEQVIISLTHEDLESIANMSIMRIQAYITARQIAGAYENNRRTSKGQPEYNDSNQNYNNSSPYSYPDNVAPFPASDYGQPYYPQYYAQ